MPEYQSLIDSLFKLPEVRYAVVSNAYGERLAGGMKPGVMTISSAQMENRLEMQAVLILKMAEEFESENGRLYYGAVRWDKVVAVFFLLSPNRATTITIEGSTPLQKVFEIENLIREWKISHMV